MAKGLYRDLNVTFAAATGSTSAKTSRVMVEMYCEVIRIGLPNQLVNKSSNL